MFAKEVQAAVLDGRADLAVHSAKDLPSVTVPGLVLASVPERGDPRDALVGSTLADLPEGAEVATGSLRRQAELRRHRPDLRFVEPAREHADAAGQGRRRTTPSWSRPPRSIASAWPTTSRSDSSVDTMLPQVAQARARGRVPRGRRRRCCRCLAAIEHDPTRRCVDAERAFLAELGGDCSLPAGAHAVVVGSGLRLEAFVAVDRRSSRCSARRRRAPTTPSELCVARHLLERGGDGLLGR